jgi:hypothetical protein
MLCKISVMKVHVHREIEEPFLAPIVRRELMRSFWPKDISVRGPE